MNVVWQSQPMAAFWIFFLDWLNNSDSFVILDFLSIKMFFFHFGFSYIYLQNRP